LVKKNAIAIYDMVKHGTLPRAFWSCCLLAITSYSAFAAENIPVAFFAREPAISDVHVSSDGRYILYTAAEKGKSLLNTVDRQTGRTAIISLGNDQDIQIVWCRWAGSRRIVCGLRKAAALNAPDHPRDLTRLIAIDADGSRSKLLVDNSFGPVRIENQIVSPGTNSDGSILAQVFRYPPRAKHTEYSPRPEVVRINVNTGTMTSLASVAQTMPDLMSFISDMSGDVIVGGGFQGDSVIFWVRRPSDPRWHELFRYRPLTNPPRPIPFAVIPGTQRAYAFAHGAHHRALFQIDLNDEHDDWLEYESDDADVLRPIFSGSGQLLGVTIDTDQPSTHYFDTQDAAVVANANKLLPDRMNEIVDTTPDKRVYVVRSYSDADPNAFYLLDLAGKVREFELVGSAYPELAATKLARTRVFHLPTSDGESKRAFLTMPLADESHLLPMIIMPDAGPDGRAAWGFSFLRQFLVSRGYAVLQPQQNDAVSARHNLATRKDLDGASYRALVSAAQWAIDQRIADPGRIAIMGWGYGGYLALLGAQRDPGLFRCAIAVNAISDLTEWPSNEQTVASDPAWLSESSPRRHAARMMSPVLLINGSRDAVVHPHHTLRLMRSFAVHGVEYEHLEIPNGTHELHGTQMRIQLLERVQTFLEVRLRASSAAMAN
jgi:dipeptidyl aminopeptidase/acylaminoacyl peptidase